MFLVQARPIRDSRANASPNVSRPIRAIAAPDKRPLVRAVGVLHSPVGDWNLTSITGLAGVLSEATIEGHHPLRSKKNISEKQGQAGLDLTQPPSECTDFLRWKVFIYGRGPSRTRTPSVSG